MGKSYVGYVWEKGDNFMSEKIEKLVKDNRIGYVTELAVRCPKELHKKHNKLPFLAEIMKIRKVEKLAPNLKDKNTCIVHIKNLNLYHVEYQIKSSYK